MLNRFCFLLIFIILFSCKKEEPTVSITPTLELNVTQDGYFVNFDWNEIDVERFDRYILIQSVQSIPETYLDLDTLSQGYETFLLSFDKTETSSSKALITPNNSKYHFRLFAYYFGRYISSNEVSLDFNPIFFNGEFTPIHHPELDIIYLQKVNSISIYDIDQNEISTSKEYDFSPLRYLGNGKTDGQEEIYFTNGFGMRIFDAITLDYKSNITIGSNTKAAINNGNLIVSYNNSNRTLKIKDKTSLQNIEWATCDHCAPHSFLVDMEIKINEETFDIYLFTPDTEQNLALSIFTFSKEGVFINSTEPQPIEGELLDEVAFSPDLKYFIPSEQGHIYTCDGELFGNVENELIFHSSFNYIFNENETQFLSIKSRSDAFSLSLYSIVGQEFQEESITGARTPLVKVLLIKDEIFLFYETEVNAEMKTGLIKIPIQSLML